MSGAGIGWPAGPCCREKARAWSVARKGADMWAVPVSEGAGERHRTLGKVVEWLTGGPAMSVKGGRGSD